MTQPLFQRAADGGVYYYQNDHLGTPQRMVDKSGAVVWEARYEAFGKAEVLKAQVGNNLRFPGQYYDQETRLHHNYFRDYDSEFGRYVQSDPIGLDAGLNFYGYAEQNPIIYLDPFGLKRCYRQRSTGTEVCEYESGEPVRPGWSQDGSSSAYPAYTNNKCVNDCIKKEMGVCSPAAATSPGKPRDARMAAIQAGLCASAVIAKCQSTECNKEKPCGDSL